MKRINLVLVLLLTLSLVSGFYPATSAQAGEIQEPATNGSKQNGGEQTIGLLGEPDDDNEGDPGNLGDGFGANGSPEFTLGSGGTVDTDSLTLEEFALYLVMMIQLMAP